MRQLTSFNAIFDRILDLSASLVGILLIFMMLFVGTGVVMRYFLRQPLAGLVEITEIGLLYICFLGAAWVLKENGHVRMDIVVIRLKPRGQMTLDIMSSIIGVIVSLVLIWYGIRVSWDAFQRGIYDWATIETPIAVILAIIPAGSFLLLIEFLRKIASTWRAGRRQSREQGF